VAKNETTNKKFPIVLVILATLLLIAMVIWVFDKRIHRIENSAESGASAVQNR
jgi:hypothetical protein